MASPAFSQAVPETSHSFAEHLREFGYAELDLRDVPGVLSLCDDAVEAVRVYADDGYNRVQDAWRRAPAIRALAGLKAVTDQLDEAYGARAFPFQTLNFHRGSQQHPHSDLLHFTPEPQHLMCGVWLALEDVHPDAGPLIYYPRSHLAPVRTLDDAPEKFGPDEAYRAHYEPAVAAEMDARGIKPVHALLKKGQAFVWAANLVHGGAPVRNAALTRRSLVTHYFFEGCDYHSLKYAGRGGAKRFRRLPQDVRTGRFVWPRGGAPRLRTIAGTVLHRLQRQVHVFRA